MFNPAIVNEIMTKSESKTAHAIKITQTLIYKTLKWSATTISSHKLSQEGDHPLQG